ncbi:hypothetical protein [Pseudomonas sp. PDM04]
MPAANRDVRCKGCEFAGSKGGRSTTWGAGTRFGRPGLTAIKN